jgi:cytosine/adenosine deaminase-related metal-dependent hydrolase
MQARAGLCERADVRIPAGAKRLDGTGKYVIPGLMDANVHLLLDVSPEYLLEANFRYEPQILEAAQIALKHGVTTVFDTWGPRAALVNVRDRINAGEALGSRILLTGNIIGFGGPVSSDFLGDARKIISAGLADRIDHEWECGRPPTSRPSASWLRSRRSRISISGT